MPSRGIREGLAVLGIDEGDPVLAKAERCLDRLGQTTALCGTDLQAVLDDLDDGRQLLDRDRFISPMNDAIDPDPEISLLLEKGEEICGCPGWRNDGFHLVPCTLQYLGSGGNGEGDEETASRV